jgi:hypothetical protein
MASVWLGQNEDICPSIKKSMSKWKDKVISCGKKIPNEIRMLLLKLFYPIVDRGLKGTPAKR